MTCYTGQYFSRPSQIIEFFAQIDPERGLSACSDGDCSGERLFDQAP
jgi:uncharacterized protein YcgI (DUF1989 family)